MKPSHGSELVQGGNLKGATDLTDYFYFFCPRCPDSHIMRVLDYEVVKEEKGHRHNDQCKSTASRTFTLKFELFCEQCRLRDYAKLSNDGWQGGSHMKATSRQ